LPEADWHDTVVGCRYALWWSLIRGCDKVEKVAGEKKADAKEALLDWFGVGVKAQEIGSFVKRMDLLAQRVSLAQSPHLILFS
jgi:chromodomain-helicase-DNA-binding protein 1